VRESGEGCGVDDDFGDALPLLDDGRGIVLLFFAPPLVAALFVYNACDWLNATPRQTPSVVPIDDLPEVDWARGETLPECEPVTNDDDVDDAD
jgi:hypothetical protein